MSLLPLLIASSIIAAVVFFLAGLLLRSSRGRHPDGIGEGAGEGFGRESERLGDQQKFFEAALEEARAASRSEADARKGEEEKRVQAERALGQARTEAERSSANERKLAERLRTAEEQTRLLFEREEKSAEAWETQLQAAQAEQKRQNRALREEADQRGAEILKQKAERDRLAEERDRHLAKADAAERALLALQGQSQQQCLEKDREKARLESAVRAGEQREQESLKREQDILRRLAEAEASHEGNLATVRIALQALQATTQGEKVEWVERVQRAEAACQAELDENRGLAVKLRALEATVEHERAQGQAAAEALRIAEARLAEMDRLAQENSDLRAQQAEADREVKWQVGRDDVARDVRVELAAAQAKLAELGSVLEENRRLRDEASELRLHQESTGELERLSVAHKQLRLDAELMARRLQELMQDRSELTSLRSQAADAASLVEEVAYLRRREKDLEAQLYASGLHASREIAALSGELPAQTPVSDMETSLHSLVGNGGPRTAVLADAQGFLIASAGESEVLEGLAAFTAVAGEMVTRARALLPLAEVDSVRVTDKNSTVLTCQLFSSAGEGLGIATLGPGEPGALSTAQAVVQLAAIVNGAEPTPNEEQEPAT